ncbi:MAG: endopeptidase La [Eubacterium sp.]|nr:endopeptidase La [Eubacterium sp.]
MRAIPVYNITVVPNVTYYFSQDYFRELAGSDIEKGEEVAFLVMKEDKEIEELTEDDFYPIGVQARVEGTDKDGTMSVVSLCRLNITSITLGDVVTCEGSPREDINDIDEESVKESLTAVKSSFIQYMDQTQWGFVARNYINQWKTLEEMVSAISSQTDMEPDQRYEILQTDSLRKRTELMEQVLYEFVALAQIGSEAESYSNESNEKLYREDAIKKQIDFLQKELDDMHPDNVSDVRKFELAIKEAGMNEIAENEANKLLSRMKQEGKSSSEYGVLYDYLDFVTGLKWKSEESPEIDLKEAQEILDGDHYGLKKVKRRILEQIAVMTLKKSDSGSILLFVGPPGTGKTSIGQSIAKALKRKYVRISLGGVRDEADIRGHRRTYIGAMPGRIMDGIRKSGSSNPVVVLDEVDKLSKDYSGDPSSALLEVLDPEQNFSFTDHYMNVPYDLSNVFFVCTANSTDTIPEPLLNRMEIIEFQGYTASEKLQIAQRHLVPKAMKAMGIGKSRMKITEKALKAIISDYTAEAGVRGLKKRIDTACRMSAVKLVRGDQKTVTVSDRKLREFLDMHPYRHDQILAKKQAGVVTGLAWTSAGGDILFIEAVMVPGSGKVNITGQLGDVMKESVQIAISLVKKRFSDKAQMFKDNDFHIHVPEGAVPKDGPSAGITMTTALVSLITDKPVDPKFAMTGEVSLRGVVLPIGGLPEKLMAAVRAGITDVFIPDDNVRDLEDVPEEVKDALNIIPVKKVDDVLKKTGIM